MVDRLITGDSTNYPPVVPVDDPRSFVLKTLDFIEKHPDNYDQGSYNICGTILCVAGHLVVQGGYKDWATDNEFQSTSTTECVIIDGEEKHVANVAARLLGIDQDDAMTHLFHGSLTLPKIRENVDYLFPPVGTEVSIPEG